MITYELAKKCKNCSKSFKVNSNRQLYCKNCKSLVRAIKNKKWQQNYYKRNVDYMKIKATKYNNSIKGIASLKLRSSIRYGKIKRKPCEVCGNIKTEGHHPDYSKPLEVIWLCRKHHSKKHVELNKK